MAQSTVGIRIAVDAGQAQAQVSALADTVDRLNAKLAEATDAGDWTGAANITATINNLAMAQGNIARVPNNGQGGGSGNNNNEQSSLGDRIVQAANQISQSMIQLGNGDIGGAAISAASGVGSGLRGVGKEIRDANPSSQLGKALGVAGVALQVISAGANAIHQNTLAYEEALPHMREYNAIFSHVNIQQIKTSLAKQGKAATEENIAEEQVKLNTKNEMQHYNAAAAMRQDTNLSTIELLDAARNETRYGKISATGAMDIAAENAKFAYANSADMRLVQDLRGTARKFGDKDDATKMANSVLVNSGASKGQMDEFLQAMKSVMEDGIANGFLKSSRDVAESMTMFARLSGNNPFWTGEQGAKRMINMGNAISSATALGDTKDAIMFSAAQDALANMDDADKAKYVGSGKDWNGTYIDTQLMLEQGVTVPFMNSYFDKINNLYGEGDVRGKVEEYKRDFNLNYTGATQLYEMAGKRDTFKTDEEYKKAVDEILENKDYLDNETRLVNATEAIQEAMVNIGKETFDIEITGLEETAKWTESIYHWLTQKDNRFKKSGAYDEVGEFQYYNPLNSQYKQLKGQDYIEATNLFDVFDDLSADEINKINESNILNTRDIHVWMERMKQIKSITTNGGDLDSFLETFKEKQENAETAGHSFESIEDWFNTLNTNERMDLKQATSKSTNDRNGVDTEGEARALFEQRIHNFAVEYHQDDEGKWTKDHSEHKTATKEEMDAIITKVMEYMGTKVGNAQADAFIKLLAGTSLEIMGIMQ